MSIRSAQRQVIYAGLALDFYPEKQFGLVSLHASVATAFAFFLSYPYQDSVALIFGSVVLVSVSLIRHYSAKPGIRCLGGVRVWQGALA